MLSKNEDKHVKSITMVNSNALSMMRSKIALGNVLAHMQKQHDAAEVRVLNELLTLDEAYRIYFKEWQRELGLQRMAADKLWPLTRDWSNQSHPACRPPQYTNVEISDVLVTAYQVHYQIILGSNMGMMVGLAAIRLNLLAMRREFSKLDLSLETPFILGDSFHKPIKFFMDLANELFNYFYSHYLKLDCGARHLDPSDLTTIENYQDMLKPCEEFEDYMMQNLSYCHCLRPPLVCPELPKPQPGSSDIQEAQRRALHSRCRRRLARMTRMTYSTENMNIDNLGQIDPTIDIEHEFRMNQLSNRLAQLRENSTNLSKRDLVNQMIYALSPSLMPTTYHPDTSVG